MMRVHYTNVEGDQVDFKIDRAGISGYNIAETVTIEFIPTAALTVTKGSVEIQKNAPRFRWTWSQNRHHINNLPELITYLQAGAQGKSTIPDQTSLF